jgi:hypothetical protein
LGVKECKQAIALEERHVLLKSELDRKLQKKHALELEISKKFQDLKRLEISLERHARKMTEE